MENVGEKIGWGVYPPSPPIEEEIDSAIKQKALEAGFEEKASILLYVQAYHNYRDEGKDELDVEKLAKEFTHFRESGESEGEAYDSIEYGNEPSDESIRQKALEAGFTEKTLITYIEGFKRYTNEGNSSGRAFTYAFFYTNAIQAGRDENEADSDARFALNPDGIEELERIEGYKVVITGGEESSCSS